MTDKNGNEIQTGMTVRISGAYFKCDNGTYFVEHSPGDAIWTGKDHCLYKISKSGKISKAKNRICFWPIISFVSDNAKAADAKKWNAKHAEIEIVEISNKDEIRQHFSDKAQQIGSRLQREIWDYGEESKTVTLSKSIKAFYEGVAARV